MIKENQLGISIKQAAEMLGISIPHTYRMVEAKKIPAMRLGNRYVISKKFIEDKLSVLSNEDAIQLSSYPKR